MEWIPAIAAARSETRYRTTPSSRRAGSQRGGNALKSLDPGACRDDGSGKIPRASIGCHLRWPPSHFPAFFVAA
jgi:hypothetical protein